MQEPSQNEGDDTNSRGASALGPQGLLEGLLPLEADILTTLMSESADVASQGVNPAAPQQTSTGRERVWHETMLLAQRDEVIQRIVRIVFPFHDPLALLDGRMDLMLRFAHKEEQKMYQAAESRDHYYHLAHQRIQQVEKYVRERLRHLRLQQVQQRLLQQQPQPPPNAAERLSEPGVAENNETSGGDQS